MTKSKKDKILEEAETHSRNIYEKAILSALMLSQNNLETDILCPKCNTVIVVTRYTMGLDHFCKWDTKCSCGKCNAIFKGL